MNMLKVWIQPDAATVNRAAWELRDVKNGMDRAMKAAVRRTATTMRSRVGKAVAGYLNVKQKDVKNTVTVRDRGDAGSEVKITGKRIPLIKFGAKWNRRNAGATYQIRRGGARTTAPGTFIRARRKSGKEAVFIRPGKARTPIWERFGPSVPHVAPDVPEIKRLMEGGASEILDKNLASQVDRLLKRSRANG